MKNERLCAYYVAFIKRERAWLLSSVMRGTEHVAFDRALNKKEGTFEFFVPTHTESVFLEVMNYLKKEGIVLSLQKKENRLLNGSDF